MLHRLVPDAKIILMTRDPVNRHWSHAKRFFSKRRFNPREGGVAAVPREELLAFFDNTRPLGEFSSMIEKWTCRLSAAPASRSCRKRRHLRDPREAYDATLEHIGVSRDYDPAKIKLLRAETNLGPRLEMPKEIGDYLEANVCRRSGSDCKALYGRQRRRSCRSLKARQAPPASIQCP